MFAASLFAKYEALSLRERALVALAVLAVSIMGWDTLLMEPLRKTHQSLSSELSSAGSSSFTPQEDQSDPRRQNLRLAGELQKRSQSLDARISDSAGGFVSAQRMIQLLNDVLDRQGRLELVSIRNLPVVSLVPPAQAATNGGASMPPPSETGGEALGQPPYVHAIEIVIDGQYADILEYLEALEALPYKFRWSTLDLSTAGYPLNRVRIELSTLSLDSTWLGV
jgi:MSHA biogenesis protein MshJ